MHTPKYNILLQKLGQYLLEYTNTYRTNSEKWKSLNDIISLTIQHNSWFTHHSILTSFTSWANALSIQNINKWLTQYELPNNTSDKTVAIISAGNIPLVNLHDFLCSLICGYNIIVKTSSKDKFLLPHIYEYLVSLDASLEGRVLFEEKIIPQYDLIIATGSDNTARYFKKYFSKVPHIIRKNRSSFAVIKGDETSKDFFQLGKDIFTYYGLGCRNVSKLFVPKNYDFTSFFEGINAYQYVMKHHKYANNYTYHKAIYLMNKDKIRDNGFLLLKASEELSSPVSVLFYQYYNTISEIENYIATHKDKIQCVSAKDTNCCFTPLGKTQEPQLSDYADNIDTINFLLKNR